MPAVCVRTDATHVSTRPRTYVCITHAPLLPPGITESRDRQTSPGDRITVQSPGPQPQNF